MDQREGSKKVGFVSVIATAAAILLIVVGYVLMPSPAREQDSAGRAEPVAILEPGQESAADSAPEQRPTVIEFMHQIESAVDKAAGRVNVVLAALLFYPVLQRDASVIKNVDQIDAHLLAELVSTLAAEGWRVEDADLTLSIPAGLLTDRRRHELAQECKRRFCKGYFRDFAVVESGEAVDGGNVPVVLRASWPGIPLAVFWLLAGAVFFTWRTRFINFRGFKHALLVTIGRYSRPEDEGEVSHFQALCAALSATVGLGNIAGVAIAITIGGPGATFWMIIAGLLGMCSKFTECTLGQEYRQVRPDGRIMGGAMFYLSKGLAELGLKRLGQALAVLFAFMCIGGSFAGGCSFQVNQSLNAIQEILPLADYPNLRRAVPWVYGLAMTAMVGIVIIGGIRRIAKTAEKIVPFMCLLYILACLYVILAHFNRIPAALLAIVKEAFTPAAGLGGMIAVLATGFQRAAFSNEAGIGSAAIAHSAARTPYPVREGIVALLEPFIDTVVVCTMTAMVMVVTGAYDNELYAELIVAKKGAALTSRALAETIDWFPYVLGVAVVIFAVPCCSATAVLLFIVSSSSSASAWVPLSLHGTYSTSAT